MVIPLNVALTGRDVNFIVSELYESSKLNSKFIENFICNPLSGACLSGRQGVAVSTDGVG